MDNIPNHVAIILDGNRRWAKRQGLPGSAGHKAGYDTLRKTAIHIFEKGIKYLSVFAFSTENFKRSKEEVDYLMSLALNKFKKEVSFFNKKGIKVIFSGRKEKLSEELIEAMNDLSQATSNNDKGTLNICLNYGGQAEIVDAAKKIAKEYKDNNLDLDKLTEENFYKYLYQDMPPIDLTIRTSGECRISNFMIYSLSYAEFIFTKVCFPDFNAKEFDKALEEYQNRNRTKGGNKA